MPKWVAILLIVAGFFALVGLAFMPRAVEVNINITDNSIKSFHAPADHGAPVEDGVPDK